MVRRRVESGLSPDQALGMTINQVLFSTGVTQTELGRRIGLSGASISMKLRGQVGWSLEDLLATVSALELDIAEILPSRGADGWVPALYVPGSGRRKAPARAGSGASEAVPPVGLEPTTFGLKVPIPEPRWAAGTETPVTPALPLNTGVDGPIAPAPAEAA